MFNQLTQKDIDAMEAEIEERKLVIRPKLLEAVKEARAHGDLSDYAGKFAGGTCQRGVTDWKSADWAQGGRPRLCAGQCRLRLLSDG